MHFQLLSGIKLKYGTKVYGPIFLSIIFLTSGIAFVSTNIKKVNEKYEEWKFHQNINLNQIVLATMKYNLDVNNQQPEDGQLKFNNVKNNVPLLNGFEIVVLVGFIVTICAVLLILNLTTNSSKYFYQQFVYKEFAIMLFYNVIGPAIYLIKKKDLRKYVWEYVTYVMF